MTMEQKARRAMFVLSMLGLIACIGMVWSPSETLVKILLTILILDVAALLAYAVSP